MENSRSALDLELVKELYSFRNRQFMSQDHLRKEAEWISRNYLGVGGDTVTEPAITLSKTEEAFVADLKHALKEITLTQDIFDNILISRTQAIRDIFVRWKEPRVRLNISSNLLVESPACHVTAEPSSIITKDYDFVEHCCMEASCE